MKQLTVSTLILLTTAATWATHLPSPNPVNGAFIVMCAAAGATTYYALTLKETRP